MVDTVAERNQATAKMRERAVIVELAENQATLGS
jgi:hypothetical protein